MSPEKFPYEIAADEKLVARIRSDATFRTMAGNFLLYSGLLAAHADGQFDDTERDYLARALKDFLEDPELMLQAMPSAESARNSWKATTRWLRENGGAETVDLFRALCALVATDNELHGTEKKFMESTAKRLDLPSAIASEILEAAFRDDPDSLI